MSRTFTIEEPTMPIALTALPVWQQDDAREALERGDAYFFDGRSVELSDDADTEDELPPILSWGDFGGMDIAEPAQLVRGLLDVGAKMVLGGGSKSFKSWVMLALALAVALGVDWLGIPCTKGRVLYINLEIRPYYLRKRVNSILAARGLGQPENLDIWNLRGFARGIEELRPLMEKRLQTTYTLIIIDPGYKILGKRVENSNEDMAIILNEIERLTVNTGAAIAVAAHFSKGDQSGKSHLDRVSGAGTWARDPDVFMTMTPHKTEGCLSVETTLRDHPPLKPFVVEWNHPLTVRRTDLNPADLKTPGRKSQYSTNDLLDALVGQMKTAEWQAAAMESTGCSKRTFHNLKSELVKGTDYMEIRGLNQRCSS